jgi:hypothetical protein
MQDQHEDCRQAGQAEVDGPEVQEHFIRSGIPHDHRPHLAWAISKHPLGPLLGRDP